MNILLYFFRIKPVYKTISVFILINFLGGIIYPAISYAMLTNGPSQPETVGYQSAGSSDNVNMVTGSFYYNIPITSIPEYPMSIGYSSGMGMDDEASCFGFGFNGFSGAINRNAMGIPDDISGSNREYKYENDLLWDASASVSVGAGVGLAVGVATLGAQASVSFTAGYNSYNGYYGVIGLSAGVGATLSGYVSVGVGANLTNDSRTEGISGGVGLNASLLGLVDINVDKSFNSSKVNSSLTVFGTASFEFGNSNFSNQGTAASYLSPLSNVVATANSFGITFTTSMSVPLPPTLVFVTASVEGAYSQFSYNNQTINKNAYGFMYLADYDRSNLSHLADFTVEGEDSWSDVNRTNPVYLQKDNFNANCAGLSGNMQFVSENYGVVSRNKSRQNLLQVKFPSLVTHTERTEVFPWHNVSRAVRNDDFDVLSFLKSSPSNESAYDFDNTMFIDEQMENLNTSSNKFSTSKMKLRFKGDMAGDFNLGSKDHKDFNPLKFNTKDVGNPSGNRRFVFLGHIKDMPMAKIEAAKTDKSYFDPNGTDQIAGGIKSATKIDYYTLSEILNTDPNGTSNLSPSVKSSDYVFYSHEKLDALVTTTKNSSSISNFNILTSLKDIVDNNNNSDKLIGDIRVTKTDGSKYIFNLPAFAKGTKQLSLNGTKNSSPISNGPTDYKTTSSSNRNKSTVTENYIYPYAWMLTAILGHDYIDYDNIPGPSDGDLGHWVKFKYIKVADNYRWRSPFKNMEHNPGALHVLDDDMYSVSSGTKEIYYLSAIESKNYVSKYNYKIREDGIAAPNFTNGDAVNTQNGDSKNGLPLPTGLGSFQYCVESIDLYNKHATNDQSLEVSSTNRVFGKIIKSTNFEYNYTISSGIPNNKNSAGKLTLTKVQHIAYNAAGTSTALPSYQFNYPTTAALNPAYDGRLKDGWGNYNKDAKDIESGSNYPLYTSYNTISKTQADENAKVFQLNSITLPTGGKLIVDYEAGGYSKVQDKKAFVMRKITEISTYRDGASNYKTLLKLDVTDLFDPVSNTVTSLDKIIKPGDNLYGEVAFYQTSSHYGPNNIKYSKYVANEQEFETDFNTNIVVDYISPPSSTPDANGRYFQNVGVKLKTVATNFEYIPFYSKFENFLFKKSDLYKSHRNFNTSNDKDTPLDAVKKIIGNLKSLLDDVSSFQKNLFLDIYSLGSNNDIEKPEHFANYRHYPHYSYLRTPVFKEKYTGTRVKSISLSDEFKLSSSTNNEGNNIYKTNYFYDNNGDGTGVSSGVASIEPMGGPSSAIDIFNVNGAGFYPSPAIYYGKVTVETGYDAVANGKYPRKKGKTQYQFYTPGDTFDDGLKLKFEDNFKSLEAKEATPKTVNSQFYLFGILAWLKIQFRIFTKKIFIQIPLILPLFVDWQRWDDYHTNSYAYTDVTDLYGRPKRIAQLDANGKILSYQQFNYAGRDQAVTVVDGFSSSGYANDPFSTTSKQFSMRPGRTDQLWSEAFYTKETSVDFMLLYMKARSNRHFNFISMKHTYLPPILKSVETSNTFENFQDITNNTKFDYFTGQPVETQSIDGNGKVRISRTTPAYWQYPEMGPSYTQPTGFNGTNAPTTSNRLTEDAASYEYLDTPTNSSLLSANVTQWSKSVNYPKSLSTRVENPNPSLLTRTHYFSTILSEDLSSLYQNANNARIVLHTNNSSDRPFGKPDFLRNNLAPVYRPVKNFVYKAAVNDATKGTFTMANFNFDPNAALDAGWKMQQENTLFSKDGDVLESRNIVNQYSSKRLINDGTYTSVTASDAQQAEMVFDGAEYIYNVGQTQPVSTDNVDLNLATAVTKNASNPSLNHNFSLPSTTLLKPNTNALIIDVQTPVDNQEKILGKLNNVIFTSPVTLKQLPRTLLICKDRNNELFVMTNRAEPFSGLYVLKGGVANNVASYRIVIDKRYLTYTASDLENLYASNTTITISSETGVETCGPSPVNKNYSLVDENVKAHTGTQVFVLEKSGVGTRYLIPSAALKSRKYSVFVWVHNSSSPQTFLVAKSGATTLETNVSSAYVTAGEWSLLRINADATAGSTFEAYVENRGGGRSVYDDFKVQPLDAKMAATVYDPLFGRVSATLNNENMATWYTYDDRGRLIEVKTEVQNAGPTIVKKYQYKDQKSN